MKIGQRICLAASTMVSAFAFCRASVSELACERTRNVSRVSSGRASQILSHSNGPESAMHALMRFS